MRQMIDVRWTDSAQHMGWFEDRLDFNVAMCRTVGMKISEDGHSITIALCVNDCGNIGQAITIPLVNVVERKYLDGE